MGPSMQDRGTPSAARGRSAQHAARKEGVLDEKTFCSMSCRSECVSFGRMEAFEKASRCREEACNEHGRFSDYSTSTYGPDRVLLRRARTKLDTPVLPVDAPSLSAAVKSLKARSELCGPLAADPKRLYMKRSR
ncbi:hypothetical protein SCAR479_06822 [Seiridium cardinale]|uniref:FLZ-type domain-containing protein n=1 Tax=Seiridium cardinale TaxID=138064 RepID=A0ABR2XS47_9PEZI